jgi:hypothetical protein
MTLTMKAHVRGRWIEALESGRYIQGIGALHERGAEKWIDGSMYSKPDSFCCLGVLCNLAYEDGAVDITASERGSHVFYDGESNYLPASVIRWAGLRWDGKRKFEGTVDTPTIEESRCIISTDPGASSLAQMNDARYPFSEIAETIRLNVLEV